MTLTYTLSFPAENDEFVNIEDARDVAFEVSQETGTTIYVYENFGLSSNKVEEVTAWTMNNYYPDKMAKMGTELLDKVKGLTDTYLTRYIVRYDNQYGEHYSQFVTATSEFSARWSAQQDPDVRDIIEVVKSSRQWHKPPTN